MNQVGWSDRVPLSGTPGASDAEGTNTHSTPDPQWAYTLAIRSALELHGRFETEVDERDAQAVVDLHWAARQAGRLLGVPVRVVFGGPVGRAEYIVSATVRAVELNGAGRAQVEQGLQRLLRSVRSVQSPARGAKVTGAGRPHPVQS